MKLLYLFLFIISLAINIFYFFDNGSNIPFVVPDSQSYINIAKQLIGFQFPDLSIRSIAYPLFIAPFIAFNNLKLATFASIVLGSFVSIFVFQIIYSLTRNKTFSFLVSIFLNLNYSVSVYQSVILTESITPFLFFFSLILHIKFIEKKFTEKLFTLLLVIDSLIILIKPSLGYLPIMFFLITIFFTKTKRYLIYLSLAAYFLIIGSQFIVNKIQNNFFGLTEVSQVNLLGKNIQYSFLDKNYLTDNQNIQNVLGAYKETVLLQKKQTDPYLIILYDLLPENKISYPLSKFLKPINNFFIQNNKIEYLQKTANLIIENFIDPTKNQPWFQPYYYGNNLTQKISIIFKFLNQFQLSGLTGCFFILAYFIINQKKQAFALSLIITSIITSVVLVSFLSYCEYDRLIAHIVHLMNLTIIYPIYFFVSQLFHIQNKTNPIILTISK